MSQRRSTDQAVEPLLLCVSCRPKGTSSGTMELLRRVDVARASAISCLKADGIRAHGKADELSAYHTT